MAVPLVGFTSALALRSSSLLHSDDSYDPINNPASDAKDRAIQEAEEQDALLQISDFLVHSDYDSNDAQWRFRVCIHDLLDEDVLAEEDQGEMGLSYISPCHALLLSPADVHHRLISRTRRDGFSTF